MGLGRLAGYAALIGVLALTAGCGGSGSVNTSKIPTSDPASGTDAAMSGGQATGTGTQGGPGSVTDSDITPKTDSQDPAQGGTP